MQKALFNYNENSSTLLTKIYFLLALSIVPTIVTTVLYHYFLVTTFNQNPVIYLLITISSLFFLQYLVIKNKRNNLGYTLLMLYTALFGIVFAPILESIFKTNEGVNIVLQSATSTLIIFAAMAFCSSKVKKVDFLSIFSIIGLFLLLISSIFNIFFHTSILSNVISTAAIIIFSAFIIVDLHLFRTGQNQSPILLVLELYLDIMNLFFNLILLLKS